jgi:hypothetical protein
VLETIKKIMKGRTLSGVVSPAELFKGTEDSLLALLKAKLNHTSTFSFTKLKN